MSPNPPQAATLQIRNEFKANVGADAASAAKLFQHGHKELVALRSLRENDSINKYPGPAKEEKLHKPPGKGSSMFMFSR